MQYTRFGQGFLYLVELTLFSIFIISSALVYGDTFNYYYRNIDGTYILKNIGAQEQEIEYSRYVSEETAEGRFIKGYYYTTEILKFADEIKYDRIINTTYYDKEENVVYTRKNSYDTNGTLISFEIESAYRDFFFYSNNEFDRSGAVLFLRSFRIAESEDSHRPFHIDFIARTYFRNINEPYFAETISLLTSNAVKKRMEHTNEEYSYNNNELIYYRVFDADGDKMVYRNEIHDYSGVRNIVEQQYDNAGNVIYNRTTQIIGDEYTEEVWAGDFHAVQKYFQREIDRGLKIRWYDDEDGNRTVLLETQDEVVSFIVNNGKLEPKETSLRFQLDPYFILPFITTTRYFGNSIILRPRRLH
jgi:hypothetical protein